MNPPQLVGEQKLPFCIISMALRIAPGDKLASICCLLIRTGLAKYFDWQYPRSRFPEYNHFLFLKCVNKGKMNSELFLWSWDFEVKKYERAINALKTHFSQIPWQHNKKGHFQGPCTLPKHRSHPLPTRMHSAFPRAGQKASQGSQQLYHWFPPGCSST